MTAARAYFVSMFILPPCEEGTTIQIVRVWSGSPRGVLTPKSWTVKHEAYRSDSDIQLESDLLISG
ncbi:hypothetical protein DVI71_17425 [Escherichia coli]|nr:hypothetical protein [Escherichia coli]EEX2877606.1 hypothetical protein [Escherichia coli]EFB1526374.1 hypothetical protein [Escherichia coli]EFO1751774.1 hypothetical protein [Escherichia coli]OKV86386.1 hypothetical protein AWP64_11790 [Escherichia coli]